MRTRAKLGIALIGWICLPIWALAEDDAGQAARVWAQFSVPRKVAALGVPLRVEFKAENTGDSVIAIDLGPFREASFNFDLMGEAGVDRKGGWQLREGVALPARVVLEPGQTYTQELLVWKWIEIEEPGRYELSASVRADLYQEGELDGPFYVGGRKAGHLHHEQILALEVLEDPGLAREVCQDLEPAALSRDAEVALPALEALSFVTAEACLTTLEYVARNAYQAPRAAVDAIDRIGGEAGVRALIGLLGEMDEPLWPSIATRLRRYCTDYGSLVSDALEAAGERGCD